MSAACLQRTVCPAEGEFEAKRLQGVYLSSGLSLSLGLSGRLSLGEVVWRDGLKALPDRETPLSRCSGGIGLSLSSSTQQQASVCS